MKIHCLLQRVMLVVDIASSSSLLSGFENRGRQHSVGATAHHQHVCTYMAISPSGHADISDCRGAYGF